MLGWEGIDVQHTRMIPIKARDGSSFVFVSHFHRIGPTSWKTWPSHAIILNALSLFNKYVLSIYYEVGTMQSTDNPGRGIYKIFNN